MKPGNVRQLLVAFTVGLAACSSDGGQESRAMGEEMGPTTLFSCTPENCPEIRIEGNDWIDRLGGAFSMRGYADPSIARDPGSGRFYMAYTYVKGGARAVGRIQDGGLLTNLAESEDGRHWRFLRTINHPAPLTVGNTRYPGMYEVADITPGAGGWYGIWLNYGKNARGGHVPAALRFELAHAPTAEELAQSPRVSLGGKAMYRGFSPSVNLSALQGAPACPVWTEPSLLVRDGHLYLLAECTHKQYHVFAAPEVEEVAAMRWRYAGAVANVAPHLAPGAQFLSQGDLAVSRDNHLLLIATPMRRQGRNNIHLGCYVIELESLDPPVLTQHDGRPVVRTAIVDPAASKLGPGACSYHAASDSGVLFVTREFDRRHKEMRFLLRATGVHP